MSQVPLLDVNAQNHPLLEEYREAFERVMGHGQFILGPEVEAFEARMAEAVGVSHAIGVSSGTDALILALLAAGIGPGDEVICPSFTFFATAGAVVRVGATPVFADVCPICFNLDVGKAAERVGPRARAVIPVHLFGQCADMRAVASLAAAHDLTVIEDAAQAIGAVAHGHQAGTMGDLAAFSFFPSKNLGGFGDAGLLTTDSEALAERARMLRVHGMKPKYHHHEVGGNFRMDALQAALLGVKAKREGGYRLARAVNAERYIERLSALPGVVVADPEHCRCPEEQAETLRASAARIVLPVAYDHNRHVWNQFTVRVPGEGRRDSLVEHLRAKGVGCEIYYPVPLHRQRCFAPLGHPPLPPCPVAEMLADEVLSLPVYPELGAERQELVVAAVESWLCEQA